MVLDIFGSQRGLTNCLIVLDILDGQKRQGWVFQVGDPKAAKAGQTTEKAKQCTNKKSSNNNRKSTINKPHKQQQHSSTNNITSSKNILEGQKRAKIGFSMVGDLEAPAAAAATKQQKQQKQQQRTGSSCNKSNTINNSKPQKRQKQHEQQGKQHTTIKASIKQQQKWQKQHKKQQKQYKHFGRSKAARVCFSHNNRSKEARMRRGKTQTNQGQEVCRRVVRGRPVEIRRDTGKFCLNWLRSKGSNWKAKVGGRGSTVGGPKAASVAKTAAAASRNRNTSNRISSTNSTNNNPETVRAKRCGSRTWEGAFSRGISFGCVRGFFLYTNKICNDWSLNFFGSLRGEANQL